MSTADAGNSFIPQFLELLLVTTPFPELAGVSSNNAHRIRSNAPPQANVELEVMKTNAVHVKLANKTSLYISSPKVSPVVPAVPKGELIGILANRPFVNHFLKKTKKKRNGSLSFLTSTRLFNLSITWTVTDKGFNNE